MLSPLKGISRTFKVPNSSSCRSAHQSFSALKHLVHRRGRRVLQRRRAQRLGQAHESHLPTAITIGRAREDATLHEIEATEMIGLPQT